MCVCVCVCVCVCCACACVQFSACHLILVDWHTVLSVFCLVADHLRGRPYHISALYVVDLDRFRRSKAGDSLRSIYDSLSGILRFRAPHLTFIHSRTLPRFSSMCVNCVCRVHSRSQFISQP